MKQTRFWMVSMAWTLALAGVAQAGDSLDHSAAATRHSGAAVSQGAAASGKAVAGTLGAVAGAVGVGVSIAGSGSVAAGQALSQAAGPAPALQITDKVITTIPPSEALKTNTEQRGR